MNFLSSIGSSLLSASSAALHQAQGGIPGVHGHLLGDKLSDYEGNSIWSIWTGTKKDDQSPVTVFSFDLSQPSSSSSSDRRSLLPLAKNTLRKLRALRHPNILKFLDGSESDNQIWIVTEPVTPLSSALQGAPGSPGMSEEAKVYGLLHICTALGFLNKDGQSVYGGLRTSSVWVTPGGEWKLGGMEVCSRLDEPDGVMWNFGGLLPDSRTYASPEVRKGGWTALKEYDPSTLDSYLLHLFLYNLFNGPLPAAFPTSTPNLPQDRGRLPAPLLAPWKRLGNPNPAARLKTPAFLSLGTHPSEGWWPQNRLVKLSEALEGFALASENEKQGLIRTLKAITAGAANAKTDPLPAGFLKYKVLPSLVHSLEFGGGGSLAAQLLPVILSLAESGGLEEKEYQKDVIQPVIRLYATPDRAVRMALLENLERYIEKVGAKEVGEKVWPHLLTGFGDVVPVIREATVKSILLIAPKLNDRILNNDLLRHLSRTQTDSEPGIRTNTCILLSRLSKHLNTSTQRKVLIPAFARALRDPFVHARIAGLMALMATAEVFEREDLAGKVIPSMSICLVDREKIVRDQAFKAIDMFVKKCEALTASMPETALPPADPTLSGASPSATPQLQQAPGALAAQAAGSTQPGIATSTSGAAGALAGWAFASVSKKLSTADLATPIERRPSAPPTPALNGATAPAGSAAASPRASTDGSIPGGFDFASARGAQKGTEDWGGDLMDVENDDADWDEFESGQAAPRTVVDPLAARLSATKLSKTSMGAKKGTMKLGSASKSSALRVPMDMDASDSWDLDEDASAPTVAPAKPRPSPIPRAAAPAARSAIIAPVASKKPVAASASLLAAAAAAPLPPPPVSPPIQASPPTIVEPDPNPWDDSATSIPATTTSTFTFSSAPPSSRPPSPLPASATPPSAPIPPSLPVIPPPLPVSPGVPPTIVPLPVSPGPGSGLPDSPASSAPVTPTLAATGVGGSMAGMSKEEKKAALERAREERRRRMAEAKAKR
ncbi:hypothetical protein JCM11641_003698 [Rhodosporidiobolus odoratus]